MAVSTKHGLYAIKIDSAVLGGIGAQGINLNVNLKSESTDDNVHVVHQSLRGQAPEFTFTTMSIAAAIDQIALAGQSISAMGAGLTLYAQKRQSESTRATGASHKSWAAAAGILALGQLQVTSQEDATLSTRAVLTSDGANHPIVKSNTATLPTLANDNERFGIGPVTVAGVTIDSIRSITLEFGVEIEPITTDSDQYPSFASVARIVPVLTIQGINVDMLDAANIPFEGAEAQHADTTIYLRKYLDKSTFVANGEAEHISLTMGGMAYVDNVFDGEETTLTVRGGFDGSNAPIIVDTASAIS